MGPSRIRGGGECGGLIKPANNVGSVTEGRLDRAGGMSMPDINKAANVLRVIVDASGGEFEGRLRLVKAFYFAHLFHLKETGKFLTDWPIVRMPKGPGIDSLKSILDHCKSESILSEAQSSVGPYPEYRYRTAEIHSDRDLDEKERNAIIKAAIFVSSRTGSELSEITHEYSNAWQQAVDGEELNLALDLLDQEQFTYLQQRSKDSASLFGVN